MTPNQGEALYGLVRWLRPRLVLEIGSYHGYSTCWIAHALKQNGIGHLWAIDAGTYGSTLNDLEYNLERLDVRDAVTLLRGQDNEVEWPSQVQFAFIDGDHSRPGVEWDWQECVARGASTIVLHDTTGWWGPAELLESVRASGEWDVLEVEEGYGLTVCKRRQDKPAPWFTLATHPNGEHPSC